MIMRMNKIIIVLLQLIFCHSLYAGAVIVPAPPAIKATSYLIMDYDSGQILAAENIDERLPPASLTKIMTAYVAGSELAENHITLDDVITVSEKAWRMPGSRMFIEVNKQVTVRELIDGIIIQSGNDASVALAEHISGDESVFAELMNQHAKRLGMVNTHFMNATGLPDEQHYSSTHDMAILGAALIRDYPDIYEIHSHKEFTFNGIKQHNRNRLLWLDNSVDGIKTGHTEEAGYCLVASAKRDDMRLIAAVMGTESEKARASAIQALLNYGFRFYETRKLHTAGEVVTTGRVWKGETDNIDLSLKDDLYVTIARGQFDKLEKNFELPERIIAPVDAGAEMGQMKLVLAGKEVMTVPLYAKAAIPEGGFFKRTKDKIKLIME
jgi:serine-type D-Ala-D-Ala carboxypeptidase (penicillin-binding protein 5/6)